MADPDQYAAVICQLAEHGYVVTSEADGYRVQHLHDQHDVSRMRHFDDLVDFAALVAWAVVRQNASRRDPPQPEQHDKTA